MDQGTFPGLLHPAPLLRSHQRPGRAHHGTVSLALSGLGLVLCLFISGALSRSIGQPVSLLDKAMAKVKKGDLSIRIRTNRQDELGRLTESFNQMTGDLQKYLMIRFRSRRI